MYSPMLAGSQTVHTCHTARIVYVMVFNVDTRCLALFGAKPAVLAFVFIYLYSE